MEKVKKFSDFGVKIDDKRFVGDKVKLHKNLNVEIVVHDFDIKPSKYPERGSADCLWLQLSIDGKKCVSFSVSKYLIKMIQQVPKDSFPFSTKVINNNDRFEFT